MLDIQKHFKSHHFLQTNLAQISRDRNLLNSPGIYWRLLIFSSYWVRRCKSQWQYSQRSTSSVCFAYSYSLLRITFWDSSRALEHVPPRLQQLFFCVSVDCWSGDISAEIYSHIWYTVPECFSHVLTHLSQISVWDSLRALDHVPLPIYAFLPNHPKELNLIRFSRPSLSLQPRFTSWKSINIKHIQSLKGQRRYL